MMQKKYIDVDDKWGIIVIYDFNINNDYDELEAIMDSFGMTTRNIAKSMQILKTKNSGMAISDNKLKMSAVFIANATSNAQWWATVAHELHHVATNIIEYYNENDQEEPNAYLHGYLFQKVVEEIATPCA